MMIAAASPFDPSDRTLLDYYTAVYRPAKLSGRAEQSHHQYLVNLRHFDRYLQRPATLADLTDETVTAFVGSIVDAGKSPATGNKARNHILAIWRYAARKGHVAEFPDVDKLRGFKHTPNSWTEDQMARLVDVCASGRWGRSGGTGTVQPALWWTGLMLLLYHSGIRIGAALRLRGENIDLETGRLTIPAAIQKQRVEQAIVMPENVMKVLRKMGRPAKELLFPWTRHRATFYNQFTKILEAAGLPSGRRDKFHRIRRTAATLAEKHVGPGSATELLGHASPEVTERYIDRAALGENRIAERLPSLAVNTDALLVGSPLSTPLALFAEEYIVSILLFVHRSADQAQRAAARLRYLLGAMGVATEDDLAPERVLGWLQERLATGMAARTATNYRQEFAAFVRWLVVAKRLCGVAPVCLAELERVGRTPKAKGGVA